MAIKRRDYVLLLVSEVEEHEEVGRTSLQKVGYFVSNIVGRDDMGYRPYYYGPFSDTLETEVGALVLSGLLTEDVHDLGFVSSKGFPAKRYIYALTDAGRDRVAAVTEAHASDARQVNETVDALLLATGGKLDQKILSAAAKTYFIAQRESRPVTTDEISECAAQLGWELGPTQIGRVADVLQRLRVAQVGTSD